MRVGMGRIYDLASFREYRRHTGRASFHDEKAGEIMELRRSALNVYPVAPGIIHHAIMAAYHRMQAARFYRMYERIREESANPSRKISEGKRAPMASAF